jgi:type III secretion protein Q
MATIIPLPMSKFSRPQAEQLNCIAARRSPLQVPDYEAFTLQHIKQAGAAFDPGADNLVAEVEFGQDRLVVTVQHDLACRLLNALNAGVVLDPFPPPDLAALLIETVLLSLLQKLERNTRRPIRIRTISPASAPPPGGLFRNSIATSDAFPAPTSPLTVDLALHGPGIRHTLTLQGTGDSVAALFRFWPVSGRSLDQLAVPASFQIGATLLPPRLLRSLRRGDAVLVRDLYAPAAADQTLPCVLRMVLACKLMARVCRAERGWRLEGGLQAEREAGYIVDQADDAHGEAPVLHDLDEVPIRLVFEAARMELSLGELRRLDSGSLLQIDVSPGTVRILAGGQPIGSGELILIDGRAGVRIVEFFAGIDIPPRWSSAR